MGGRIPYTVNPAVRWNMTWPSSNLNVSNPQSHSIRVVSPSLLPPVTYHACLHDSRLALTDLCLKPPSPMHADVITVRFFFLQRGAWQCSVCCFLFSFFWKDPAASYDFNDNDPDPFPRYDSTNENKWVFCWEATFSNYLTFPFSYSHSVAQA